MTQLYRHFDAENNLMYVGISLNVFQRLSQHRDHSRWFGNIKRVEIEHFETREKAIIAEKNAIKTENPKFNINSKKTAKEINDEEKLVERQKQFLKSFVEHKLAYKLNDVKISLYMTANEINKHIDAGNLAVFFVEGRPSWKTKQIAMRPMVSGWALIDFINFLESKEAQK